MESMDPPLRKKRIAAMKKQFNKKPYSSKHVRNQEKVLTGKPNRTKEKTSMGSINY